MAKHAAKPDGLREREPLRSGAGWPLLLYVGFLDLVLMVVGFNALTSPDSGSDRALGAVAVLAGLCLSASMIHYWRRLTERGQEVAAGGPDTRWASTGSDDDAAAYDWPAWSQTEVPSPQLVAAWLILGRLRTERVPLWAAHWLAAGQDGPILAELAGLHGDDPFEVRDLLPAALTECGVPVTDLDHSDRSHRRAVAMTAFTLVAKRCMDGRASERRVVTAVVETAEPDFDRSVTDLPLGSLVGLDEEWAAEWGRTEEELRAEVRRACQDQLRAARTPSVESSRNDEAGAD